LKISKIRRRKQEALKMAINGRNTTAAGGFTLPQHAFLPHESTRPFGHESGAIQSPLQTAGISAPQHVTAPNVHGVEHLPLVQVFGFSR
jgi:hypothetical protein